LLDITDRRRTEDALRESEARLRQVIDLVPHFIFAKDRQGHFILVNQAVADNYGTTVEQLTGMTDGDFNPDQVEVEHFLRDDLLVIDSGRPMEIPEEKITDARGHTRILQTTKIPFTVSLTGEDAVLGVSTDITGYKMAQKALQQSEEKYRQIFENTVEGIFQTAPNGQLISANTSLARMDGYDSAQEMMEAVNDFGKPLYVHPEDRLRLTNLLKEHGSAEKYEVQVCRKDGSEFWVSINAHTIFDESGQADYFEGTVEDITKRRYFERALQESEAKYRSVVESSLVGFYIVQDGLFRFVNQRLCDITGYPYEESVNIMNPLDIIHPDDRMNVAENMEKRLSESEDSVEYGFRATRKDGKEIAVKVFGTSINYNGKRALCGTIIDVTREKTMESQLIQAQKMEAIGTLAGGIAHDFNNILGAMMGYAELAKLKTTDSQIQPYLEPLLKACDRAKDLVNQILTFSRKKEHEKKPLSITPIAKEALKLLRSSLPTTIDVRIHFQNRHDKVLADATQIHQVLINLCTNASHAMRERGGILEITFSQQEITADEINHDPALKRGMYLKIVISDTGHGIDAAIRDKIFDPFFTTKKPGEGTGLGLAMVYGIIKNHGGVISVTSEPGKGTTFTIYLPLIDMEAQAEEQGMEAVIGGKGHILLVDDEEPLASIGKEMLISLGYDVTVRFSSLDALEAFRANPHRFNLVITDTTMPNMTGPQMAKEMLKIYPGLPIILTTGYSDMINETEAKEMGIQEFIMKPISLQNLAQVVRKVLH